MKKLILASFAILFVASVALVVVAMSTTRDDNPELYLHEHVEYVVRECREYVDLGIFIANQLYNPVQ